MDPNKKVSEIMTSKMITVGPNDLIKIVRGIFESNDFHHIPVTGRGNKLVGIISKEDLSKVDRFKSFLTPEKGEKVQLLRAKDIMTKYPLQLDPEDTVGLAADILLANKFHALPITDEEELVGIVTSHDLLEYSYKSVLDC